MARVVDYEAAWDELVELILSREGWGKRALITEMAHLRVKHTTMPEDSSSVGGATTASGRRDDHGTTERSEEDHDGSSDHDRAHRPVRAVA